MPKRLSSRQLLGGLDAASFLKRHWQKRPLLVRGALPGFRGLLDLDGMKELATHADCESRLVLRHAGQWRVEHGPFRRNRLARLPPRDWTLLIQGLDQLLPEARHLLSYFDFIPYGRLDDLMVSYAPPGGGVGPHFDSYDVFLVQGPGQRRWQVGRQRDLTLKDDLPLKILERFAPDGECVLSSGDMLYLPPEYAHDGVALDACYTYSVGFRAPSHRELKARFLDFLEDRIGDTGRYGDPDLKAQERPARIGPDMISKVQDVLESIEWRRRDVAAFLGGYLSEPKPNVVFSPPARPLSRTGFSRLAQMRGLRLAAGTRMLYAGSRVYINGESHPASGGARSALLELADRHCLPGRRIPSAGPQLEALYRWYCDGYICLQVSRRKG